MSIDLNSWVGVGGIVLTAIGVWLTYLQAKNARLSVDHVKREVSAFSLKRSKSEAMSLLGEARASMEVAGLLINAEHWREATSVYDEARKSVHKAMSMTSDLNSASVRKLRLVCDHLMAFSNSVDNALAGKDNFPDSAAIRASIRKNSDELTMIQRELHEGL